jgi:hypothetical protein
MYYLYIVTAVIVLYLMFFNNSMISRDGIKKLVQKTAKWATIAQQDASPVNSLLHANYAAGYLWALKDLASDNEIHRVTGIDVKKFEEHVTNMQEMVTKRVIKRCPEFEGEIDLYLSTIAGS